MNSDILLSGDGRSAVVVQITSRHHRLLATWAPGHGLQAVEGTLGDNDRHVLSCGRPIQQFWLRKPEMPCEANDQEQQCALQLNGAIFEHTRLTVS